MFGHWQRLGDFFRRGFLKDPEAPYRLADPMVRFVNDAPSAVITMVTIEATLQYRSSHYTTSIGIRFSPMHHEKLFKICDELSIGYRHSALDVDRKINPAHLGWFHKNGLFYSCAIDFDLSQLSVLMQFISRVNAAYSSDIFTPELFNEFKIIDHALQSNDFVNGAHLMPESVDVSRINRKKSGHTALTEVLYYHSHRAIKSRIKRLLMHGHDPNECDEFGDTPLRLAIIRVTQDAEEIAAALLVYDADPYLRIHEARYGMYCSALDTAKAYGNSAMYNLIVASQTKISRQISQPSLTVNDLQINYDGNVINSVFKFSNQKTITTHLTLLKGVMAKQLEELYVLFCSGFCVLVDDNKQTFLKAIFSEDFTADKLLEIIYDGKMIGFNLFEIITTDKEADKVFLHCVYALIAPDYRNYGLMMLLSFRPAYSLQYLLPHKQVGVVFCAVDFLSYRMVDWPHFPKYQTENTYKLIINILDVAFKQSYELHRHPDSVTCYVIEQLKVRHLSSKRNTVTLRENFYKKEILGYAGDNTDLSKPRAAPVLFFVDPVNRRKMSILADNLNINFTLQTIQLAEALQWHLIDLLRNKISDYQIVEFPESSFDLATTTSNNPSLRFLTARL